MRRATFAWVLVGLALAGCGPVVEVTRTEPDRDQAVAGNQEERPETEGASGPQSQSEEPASSTGPSEGPAPQSPRPVSVAFGGDVHGEPPVAGLLADGGDPLAGVAAQLAAADLAIVNLETAVGTTGSPAPKQFAFQADPALLSALAAGGVDVVSVANNHSLDYGVEALLETLALADEAGLATVGGGRDAAEAYAPHYAEVDGQTVAVVGLTRVIPYPEWAAADNRPGLASTYEPGLPAALDAIAEARQQADWVVVAVHWGQEGAACPDRVQTGLAREFVDAGADVVAGHHPHVLQGVQELDGAVVAYSLGNFVWYAGSDASRTTGVLTVDLDPDGDTQWALHPARIDATGSPVLLADDDPERDDAVAAMVADRSPGGDACADIDWP